MHNLDLALIRAALHGFGLRASAFPVQSLFGGAATGALSVREKSLELGLDRRPDSTALASVSGIGMTSIGSRLGLGFRRSLESQQSGRLWPGALGRTGAPDTIQPVGSARTL